ncbi:hypothetical protein V500_01499 [Pseudogymnoascus sp. VKM F-4518 (FW-2643)]|nr:hypothetical protein V500_01499 [Pseudogymnoascus sp. VKM F-4518 (FW-2643)]
MASAKWNEMLSSAETNFTWLNTINNGPSPIICPDDTHGEMDLTSELDSVFAKLQKNIKLLQNEWIKTEKAASDIERENQQLRIENSRLIREATGTNKKSTVEFDQDEFVAGW